MPPAAEAVSRARNAPGVPRAAFVAIACLGTHSPTLAQWQAVSLTPPGIYQARAHTTLGGLQGGYTRLANTTETTPGLWSGSASTWVSLLPAGLGSGRVNAMTAQYQVGTVAPPFTAHAALWSGSAQSFVDLHPSGARGSYGQGAAGDQQVGFVEFQSPPNPRAGLWRGTAASFVNLHPAGAYQSWAYATDGVRQGGELWDASFRIHAALWDGSAASFTSLNPPGVTWAEVHAMAPGVQVGFYRPSGLPDTHAAVWSGTAASILDLNPPGSIQSELLATTGSKHAGRAWFGGQSGACLWLDNSGSNIVDLHALLPPIYLNSTATGVYEENGQIWVSGYAQRSGGEDALLWTNIPAPGAAPLLLAAGLFAARRRRR